MACLGFGLFDVTTSKIALCVGIKWLFYDFPPRPAPRDRKRAKQRQGAEGWNKDFDQIISFKHEALVTRSILNSIDNKLRLARIDVHVLLRISSTIAYYREYRRRCRRRRGQQWHFYYIVFIVTKEIRTPFVRWLEHPVAQRRCHRRHCCYHSRCCIHYTIFRSQCAVCLYILPCLAHDFLFIFSNACKVTDEAKAQLQVHAFHLVENSWSLLLLVFRCFEQLPCHSYERRATV